MANDAGTNWTLIEDVMLCSSWVEVTHDLITGNKMQLQEMWSNIHPFFLEKIDGKRTKQSLSSRWRILSQSLTHWRNALAQAITNIRSGENYADQTLQAQAWYNAKNKNNSFNWWESWNIVKDCPKFKVVPIDPEVVMNNTHLLSMPDHDSHVHESDTEQVREVTLEQVSGSTCYPLRPQGKKASKRKGSSSKNDYTKYIEELPREVELTLVWEMAKFEADKARDEAKAVVTERLFRANDIERELLRQEREELKKEIRAQQDRYIMKEPVDAMSPNSKYFWNSEKKDVARRRHASRDGSSTTKWLGDDFPFMRD